MKKYIYALIGLGAMTMASCSDDIDVNIAENGQQVEVTFSAALPAEMLSRAVSDGATADQLSYTVFKSDGTQVLTKTFDAFSGTSTTESVSIPLITGETYNITFWADKKDGPYSYDGEKAIVTVDYTKANANDEDADAFFWTETNYKVTGSESKTVYLTRPFAQINFGTTIDDYKAAVLSGLDVSKSAVSVGVDTYSKLNLLDGSVEDQVTVDVTYASFATPTDDKNPFSLDNDDRAALTITNSTTQETTNYVYVGYAYVLVGPITPTSTSETINKVTLTPNATTACERLYTNVPVKRNYRTNIIGNLFTSTTEWTVIIDQEYDGDIDLNVWEGKIEEPTIDSSTKTIQVANANQLAWIAEYVNDATEHVSRAIEVPYDFSEWTVELTEEIYLNNEPWTPIGKNADGGRKFKGTFDGKGHTIYGLHVEQEAAYHAAGLFGALNGTAKDFTIEGAYVKSLSTGNSLGNTDNGIAVVAGSIYTSGKISGVTVKNAQVYGNRYTAGIAGYCYGSVDDCTIDGLTIIATPDNLGGAYDNGDKVGGIIGYLAGGIGYGNSESFTVTGNKVTNLSLTAYRDMGGIIGGAGGGNTITGNEISASVICYDPYTNGYKDFSSYKANAGEIIGRDINNQYNSITTDNTIGSDVEITSGIGTVDGQDITSSVSAIEENGSVEITVSEIVLTPETTFADGVTLSGQGADATTIVIETDSKSGLTIGGTGVTISDFTIDGSQVTTSGNAFSSALNVTASDVTISDCDIQGGGAGTYSASVLVEKLKDDEKFTINNCTITGAFRGIMAESQLGDIYVNDCTLIPYCYPINIDGGGDFGLYVTNTVLCGWTSYSTMTDGAHFTGCEFKKAPSGYGSYGYDYLRAFCSTELIDCTFDEDFKLDVQKTGYTLTLTNCTKNGVEITAENAVELLAATAANWANWTVKVNDTTVTFD